MEIRPKHVVVTLAILAGGFALLKNQISDWKKILPQIKALPTGLRNLQYKPGVGFLGTLTFDIDITLFNPTSQIFNPDGILAEIDRVELTAFKERIPIGTLDINQGYVNIPAHGSYVLRNKTFSVPVNLSLVDLIKRIKSPNDINVTAIMKVLGTEYTI